MFSFCFLSDITSFFGFCFTLLNFHRFLSLSLFSSFNCFSFLNIFFILCYNTLIVFSFILYYQIFFFYVSIDRSLFLHFRGSPLSPNLFFFSFFCNYLSVYVTPSYQLFLISISPFYHMIICFLLFVIFSSIFVELLSLFSIPLSLKFPSGNSSYCIFFFKRYIFLSALSNILRFSLLSLFFVVSYGAVRIRRVLPSCIRFSNFTFV